MGINAFYAATVSPWLRKTELGERLDMALVAFNANLQFVRFMYAESGSRIFSEQEIAGLFSDLDSKSLAVINRFMARQYKAPPNGLMVHPKYFYTEAEKACYRSLLKDFKSAIRRFRLPRHLVGPESLYYHHGLRQAPEFIKKNVAGKLFGDVGGWIGDSTLAFIGYNPAKTIIFEPDETLRATLEKNLKRNRVPGSKYDILPFALSDKRSRLNGFDCCTLDEIRADYPIPFGLLKADIEGMGAAFVRGARKTIAQDRPMLSLAVYHNEEEFVGIYRMLKAWDLDYKFEFKALNPFTAYGEVTLLAYPAEWAES